MPAYGNNPYQYPPYYGHQQYGQPQQYTHHQQNQPQYIQQYSQPPYVQPPQNQPLYIQQPQHTFHQGNLRSNPAGRVFQSHNSGDYLATHNGSLIVELSSCVHRREEPQLSNPIRAEVQELLAGKSSRTSAYDSSIAGRYNETLNGSFVLDATLNEDDSRNGHGHRWWQTPRFIDPSLRLESVVRDMQHESIFVTQHTGDSNEMWNGCRDRTTSRLYRSRVPFYFRARNQGKSRIYNGMDMSQLYPPASSRSSGSASTHNGQCFYWENSGGLTHNGV
ncbi:hypothetical protein VNI00_019126 [Paramarasmius palmivorus]|uniref:Uncharacterized protein n=1 Tax=Paramarasmius palmivorus TaxID=297713 RepID=A0AAW0AQC7_9AGAR